MRPYVRYDWADVGLSHARERLLRELMNNVSMSASSSQIRPSNAFSSLQGTTSAVTNRPITLADIERTVEILTRHQNDRNYHIYQPLIPMEIGRIDGQVRIIETPKGNKMNEIMEALEAMMRRIVQEELKDPSRDDNFSAGNFRALLKDYADNNKPEFAAIVSQGALDQPWFDDAIKAEVAEATPAAQGVVFEDKTAFNKAVRDFVLIDAGVEDWVNDSIVQRVRDMDFSVSVDR